MLRRAQEKLLHSTSLDALSDLVDYEIPGQEINAPAANAVAPCQVNEGRGPPTRTRDPGWERVFGIRDVVAEVSNLSLHAAKLCMSADMAEYLWLVSYIHDPLSQSTSFGAADAGRSSCVDSDDSEVGTVGRVEWMERVQRSRKELQTQTKIVEDKDTVEDEEEGHKMCGDDCPNEERMTRIRRWCCGAESTVTEDRLRRQATSGYLVISNRIDSRGEAEGGEHIGETRGRP
ncbi:hypothetical protein R3P38DRAFT_3195431 [Favolaschia claudopus]|uniref:Uncharacterized protein n=1 Tax=Favolaschia claudopus TaxID=2862362 RepID=A0AAW0BC99_9AGAR